MLQYLWAKKTTVFLFSFGLLLAATPNVIAETVIEKVARTGTLTAGTSKDALPFAFRNDDDELVGYSIDIFISLPIS